MNINIVIQYAVSYHVIQRQRVKSAPAAKSDACVEYTDNKQQLSLARLGLSGS